jgi:hypothetical protein
MRGVLFAAAAGHDGGSRSIVAVRAGRQRCEDEETDTMGLAARQRQRGEVHDLQPVRRSFEDPEQPRPIDSNARSVEQPVVARKPAVAAGHDGGVRY